MVSKTPHTTETKLLGACNAIKAQINRLDTLNKSARRSLERDRARLAELEKQPKPDAAGIAALKEIIKDARERLTLAEEGLHELKDIFAESCG